MKGKVSRWGNTREAKCPSGVTHEGQRVQVGQHTRGKPPRRSNTRGIMSRWGNT